MTGKDDVDAVKPVPVKVGALMVKGKLPVELSVKVCVEGVFTVTLPNATEVALMVRIRVAASN